MWKMQLNMAKKCVALLSTLFLAGCLGMAPNMQKYSDNLDTKDKAVIIAELTNADTVQVIKFDQNFANKQRKEFKLRGRQKLWSIPLTSYRQVMFVTEPGIYFISKAEYRNGDIRYITTLDGITPEGRVIYGAFEVKAGEVAYIGDLHFNWNRHKHKDKNLVETTDHYSKVTADLQASEKYQHLAKKLKVAKFYPRNSVISLNEAGVAAIE